MVRVGCPRCGQVSLYPADVTMLLEPDTSTGWYFFTCPACDEPVTNPVDIPVARALASAGVRATFRARRNPAPPLSEDDLIDFGRRLEKETDPWTELHPRSSLPG